MSFPNDNRPYQGGDHIPPADYQQSGYPSAGNQPGAQPIYQAQYQQPQPARRPSRRRQFRLACFGCLIVMIASFLIFSCVFVVIGLVVYSNYDQQLGEQLASKEKELSQNFQTATIYDRRGNELHELFTEGRRTNIKLADMPKYLLDATIAVEDSSFYDNPGIDWVGISRAGLQYFQSSSTSSGGSTITQQLVRNIAFDYSYRTERSARRKLEEIVMALILTREKSKDEILEMYLNQIYYGNVAYGIEAASQTYFGKSAKELNLAEASLLAGLPQAPAELDPLNPEPKVQEAVYARRQTVLNLMVDKGKITREQADEALAQPLVYANPNVSLKSPHFTLYAEQEIKDLLESIRKPPSYLTTGGLKIYTTLDNNIQDLAERIAQQQIASIKAEHNANNAAVVVLKPTTGEILAMVGSVNYRDDSIQGRVNVATSPKQPGSAMKPLTYAAALERGYSPSTILWDVPTRIESPGGAYAPVNYDGGFRGPVRMRYALANSYNIPAVQMLREIGVDALLRIAQRFGVNSLGTDTSQYGLSLTLGGGELTPLELTRAYTVFANGGKLVPSTSILCVIDGNGDVIYQYENGCQGRGNVTEQTISPVANGIDVLDPHIAYTIADILSDNVARSPAMGSNSALRTDGILSSVKTGTTNDFRDNWTVGFTRNVAVGVWVGNTDSSPMIHTTGLTGAAPIWHDIITGIYSNPQLIETLKRDGNLVPDDMQAPAGMVKRRICDLSSLKDPSPACDQSRSEWHFEVPILAPDSNGNLVPSQGLGAPTPAPANGPIILSVEDGGVVQSLVNPIDPSLAMSLAPVINGRQQSPPKYCLVPNEVKDQIPSATAQLFIQPPPFADQAASAYTWATNNGFAILPQNPCTPEMLMYTGQQQAQGITAFITSPQAGQQFVQGMVQVTGTAMFPQGGGTYFKMEISGPQFPNWVTFGATHTDPVANGVLDSFGAEGIQSGTYRIRITVIGPDGNVMGTSPEVPIIIGQ